MGIKVEFNPDLCLRNYSEFTKGNRKEDECLPKNLEAGKTYSFLKKDQRCYWLMGEIPLRETKGGEVLSRPKASVRIIASTHFLIDGQIWTRGEYLVVGLLSDDKVYFDGFEMLR